MIEELLSRFVSRGILDDGAYAKRRAEALRGRGESRQRVAQRLARAGIDRDDAARALTDADASSDARGSSSNDPELAAAIRFAQRRRLGPFRVGTRQENRNRDLAAMARAGFQISIARRVIDVTDPSDLA